MRATSARLIPDILIHDAPPQRQKGGNEAPQPYHKNRSTAGITSTSRRNGAQLIGLWFVARVVSPCFSQGNHPQCSFSRNTSVKELFERPCVLREHILRPIPGASQGASSGEITTLNPSHGPTAAIPLDAQLRRSMEQPHCWIVPITMFTVLVTIALLVNQLQLQLQLLLLSLLQL